MEACVHRGVRCIHVHVVTCVCTCRLERWDPPPPRCPPFGRGGERERLAKPPGDETCDVYLSSTTLLTWIPYSIPLFTHAVNTMYMTRTHIVPDSKLRGPGELTGPRRTHNTQCRLHLVGRLWRRIRTTRAHKGGAARMARGASQLWRAARMARGARGALGLGSWS
jgi:hypothetical protein